jgi:hypothetical protein
MVGRHYAPPEITAPVQTGRGASDRVPKRTTPDWLDAKEAQRIHGHAAAENKGNSVP